MKRSRSKAQVSKRAGSPAQPNGDRTEQLFFTLFGPRPWTPPDTDEPAERQEILLRMSSACAMFYGAATQTGCHAFIEFAGLMKTFIDGCREAENEGHEWVYANVHGGNHLPLAEHQVGYLREKLECIYRATFQIVPLPPKPRVTAPDRPSRTRVRRTDKRSAERRA